VTQAQTLVALARSKELRVATAESCTGGMVSAAITDVAGSSAVFDRGFVTYTNAAKVQMLNVKPETLELYGAVSEQIAVQMAHGALANSRADIAVSITGIAGPGGSDHKPEGRVCFALCTKNQTRSETIEFGAIGRATVRAAATQHALCLLITEVTSHSVKK
tara:strand:- start:22052 stop:22537 length:486 start_codon:yes stop_codon:yes gene_type:complete